MCLVYIKRMITKATPNNELLGTRQHQGLCSGTEHYSKLFEKILEGLSNHRTYIMENDDTPDNSDFIIKSSFFLIETDGISGTKLSEGDPNYLAIVNIKECAHAMVNALKKIIDTKSDGQLIVGNISCLLKTTSYPEDKKKTLTVDLMFPDAISANEISDFVNQYRNEILREAKLQFKPSGHMLQ